MNDAEFADIFGDLPEPMPEVQQIDPGPPQVQPAQQQVVVEQYRNINYGGVGQPAQVNAAPQARDFGRDLRWEPIAATEKPSKQRREYNMVNEFGAHELVVHRQWAFDQARRMMAAGLIKGDTADAVNQARAIESYLFRNKSDASNK